MYMHRDPPFYLKATGQLHHKVDYKRSGILTVNGFISATKRFKNKLKNKTNHPISSNSHPSVNAVKVLHPSGLKCR